MQVVCVEFCDIFILEYLSHYIIISFRNVVAFLNYGIWLEDRQMINFEEELKNFQPSLEVEEAEAAIYNHDLTDVTDIINEMLTEIKQNNRR